jgi:urate oxidase/2-oxo-4-hydroxy-4-carboxy-5-ureidoimidazoline decarboxylase
MLSVTAATLGSLNALSRDAFVARVGSVFEDSPWIAAAAWEERPFASVAELHAAMRRVIDSASLERQLGLIRAHPDLAGRATATGELTAASQGEQSAAGLDRLPPDTHARLAQLTSAYRERFNFPFVACVREHTIATLLEEAQRRLDHDAERERQIALDEIAKIAELRLRDVINDRKDRAMEHRTDGTDAALSGIVYDISYGKSEVPVYRQYATPLRGLNPVPESSFTGRDNVLFANQISIRVFGENFVRAYTHGDNTDVVATDSMKNLILREGRTYSGATLEGYLDHLGGRFLTTYEQMHGVLMSGRELPFSAQPVPSPAGGFEPSGVLRQRQWSDCSTAELRYQRDGGGWEIVDHRCGRVNIELLKTKGSAFTKFVRDEYTTLPDRVDRPLFLRLTVHWHYADPTDALGANPGRYVAGEQVRDVCAVVFDEFVSESIQELLHEMGKRMLARYPQLRRVELVGMNMTREPYAVSDDPEDDRKVFVPPFPALGTITLAMTRSA